MFDKTIAQLMAFKSIVEMKLPLHFLHLFMNRLSPLK